MRREYESPNPSLLHRWGHMWAQKTAKYSTEFFAAAPTPDNGGAKKTVYDTRASISAVFTPGWRTYAFRQECHRDEFVRDVPNSLKVENPL